MDDERREYREALENLRFSDEAKERMARNLTARAHASAETARPQKAVRAARGGARKWRYVAAVAAAAALVLAVGGGAYASGALMSMANVFDDAFGGAPAQTEVVDKIGHPVGASATSAGVTVTAEAIVGDRTNYVIVFSVAKDDGTAFEGVEPLENGYLPLGFEGAAGVRVDGVRSAGGSAYFYDADPTDNAVQYVKKESITLDDGGSVIGKTARVELADLKAYGDGEPRTIAEGTWKMKFAVHYEDTSIDLPSGQTVDLNGMRATIDALSISPVAITADYTVHAPMDWLEQGSGRLTDENAAALDRFIRLPLAVNLEDGTVIDATKSGGGTRPAGQGTACNKSFMFDGFVNLDDVASVTVGGTTTIPLA